jgi:hypothetical protein
MRRSTRLTSLFTSTKDYPISAGVKRVEEAGEISLRITHVHLTLGFSRAISTKCDLCLSLGIFRSSSGYPASDFVPLSSLTCDQILLCRRLRCAASEGHFWSWLRLLASSDSAHRLGKLEPIFQCSPMRLPDSFCHSLVVPRESRPGDLLHSERRCQLRPVPGFQTKPRLLL